MPSHFVPDTSVFIQAIRKPSDFGRFHRDLTKGRVWLSSVVAAELYAGTRSPDDGKLIDQIVNAMKGIDRLLVPSHADWVCAAQLIRRYSQQHGSMETRDHYADALIVVSASNIQAEVQTYNLSDFERWAELARAAGRKVTAVKYEL